MRRVILNIMTHKHACATEVHMKRHIANKCPIRTVKIRQVKEVREQTQQLNRCKLSSHDTHPADFIELDTYEVPVLLTEGRELVSLFIEAFPDYLMGDKKNKNKCIL